MPGLKDRRTHAPPDAEVYALLQCHQGRVLLGRSFAMAHRQFKSCIEACYACAEACDHCAQACLQEQDVKALARCISLDIDCAEICRMAAGYMARDSQHVSAICGLCAEICDNCGDECSRHTGMEHCQRCAEACRRCAEECRRMAGQEPRRAHRATQPAAQSFRANTLPVITEVSLGEPA